MSKRVQLTVTLEDSTYSQAELQEFVCDAVLSSEEDDSHPAKSKATKPIEPKRSKKATRRRRSS